MVYEVLFFDGSGPMPAYYLLGGVEGETAEEALRANLQAVTRRVRQRFNLRKNEVPDGRVQQMIHVLRDDGLVPARDVRR